MTRVLDLDAAERVVVAEAGVINDDLRQAVAAEGLWYPPDPASYRISTIGGNVATNAGGICCVKYGVTRDYVLGMTVVLADGEIVRLGRRTAKGATGYDLTALMVGSEGTLGIITEVTLKLLPLGGREERAIVGSFPSLEAAGVAVAAIGAAGIIPSALELDRRDVPPGGRRVAVARAAARRRRAAAGDGRRAGRRRSGGRGIRRPSHGGCRALAVEQAASPDEVERLFLARRLAYPALERLGPVLTEDICVPRRAVPEMLARIRDTAAAHDVVIATIAHARRRQPAPADHRARGRRGRQGPGEGGFDRIVDDCRASAAPSPASTASGC